MTRKNDLWIMNSLAFDNVVAINERNIVAESLIQVDANSTKRNDTELKGKNDFDQIFDLENVDGVKHSNSDGSHGIDKRKDRKERR